MYSKCCVPGCANLRKDALLHKFPKCVKRLKKWLDQINSDFLRTKNISDLNTLQVCHKHFEHRFVTKKAGLVSIAYPTLFLESEILSGIPVKPNEDPVNYLQDHNYIKIKIIHNDHNYYRESPPESHTPEIIELSESPSTSNATTYFTSIVEDEPQLNTLTFEDISPTSTSMGYPICINEIGPQFEETLSLAGTLPSTSNVLTCQIAKNNSHFGTLTLEESRPSISNTMDDGAQFETLSLEGLLPSTLNTVTCHISPANGGPQFETLSLDVTLPSISKDVTSETYVTENDPQQGEQFSADMSFIPEKEQEYKEKKQNPLPAGSVKPKRRPRFVSNVKALPPNSRIIYDALRKSQKLLSFTRRSKKALEVSKKKYFEENAEKMNPLAKKFLLMQLKLCKMKNKGRRFTMDEKLIALAIQKQGPDSYKLLQRIFILPSETTLKKLVTSLETDSDVQGNICESINEEHVAVMDSQ